MNFTAPRYAILFSNSQNHIVHVINHKWNRSMNVASAVSFVWDTKPDFPSHMPKARGENLAHKGFIARMNCHLLIEMASMLHRVKPSIVNGKGWLLKSVGKPGLIDSSNKGWFRNIQKCFTHRIIPHVVVGWPLAALVLAFFLVYPSMTMLRMTH